MTLIICATAAALVTAAYYVSKKPELHLGVLALIYWGASLMWFVDGITSVCEGGSFVELSDTSVMADDALLGVVVVVVGLVAWGAYCAIKNRSSQA